MFSSLWGGRGGRGEGGGGEEVGGVGREQNGRGDLQDELLSTIKAEPPHWVQYDGLPKTNNISITAPPPAEVLA